MGSVLLLDRFILAVFTHVLGGGVVGRHNSDGERRNLGNLQHSGQQNEQYCSLIFMLQYHTEYSYVFRKEPTKAILQKTKLATFVHSRHDVCVCFF